MVSEGEVRAGTSGEGTRIVLRKRMRGTAALTGQRVIRVVYPVSSVCCFEFTIHCAGRGEARSGARAQAQSGLTSVFWGCTERSGAHKHNLCCLTSCLVFFFSPSLSSRFFREVASEAHTSDRPPVLCAPPCPFTYE